MTEMSFGHSTFGADREPANGSLISLESFCRVLAWNGNVALPFPAAETGGAPQRGDAWNRTDSLGAG